MPPKTIAFSSDNIPKTIAFSPDNTPQPQVSPSQQIANTNGMPGGPPPPNIVKPVLDVAKGGIQTAKSGLKGLLTPPDVNAGNVQAAARGGGPIAGAAEAGAQVGQAGFEGVANLGKVVGGTAAVILSPILAATNAIGTPIGKALGNLLSDDQAKHFADFVNKNPQMVRTAGDLANLANLAFPELKDSLTLPAKGPSAEVAPGTTPYSGAPQAVKNAANTVAHPIENIGKPVVGAGKNLVTKAVGTPVPTQVASALKEMPTAQFDKLAQITKDATQSFKNQTPMEFSGIEAQRGLNVIGRKLGTIGENKSAIMDSSAGRTKVGNIVTKFQQSLNNAVRDTPQLIGDEKLIRDVTNNAKLLGNNPSAQAVDRFVDFVQNRVYSGQRDLTVPQSEPVERVVQRVTGELNNALKDKMPESYRTLNKQYSDMVQVRNELNTKLGKEGERGGALMKRVFSPSDNNTKILFKKVHEITGIDLVNIATVAKHLMEVSGDARQKSLLEDIGLLKGAPPTTLTKATFDVGVHQLKKLFDPNSPEARIQRARELTKG